MKAVSKNKTRVGLHTLREIKQQPDLRIVKSQYDADTRSLILKIQARDIQGETGTIELNF